MLNIRNTHCFIPLSNTNLSDEEVMDIYITNYDLLMSKAIQTIW